jgi:hypothetical protein
MPALIWLGIAIAAAALAYAIGRPAWRSYQAREARDANVDRYLAWRGKAPPRGGASVREGMTGEERRNLIAAAALAGTSLIALVAFFVTS